MKRRDRKYAVTVIGGNGQVVYQGVHTEKVLRRGIMVTQYLTIELADQIEREIRKIVTTEVITIPVKEDDFAKNVQKVH